MVKWVSALDLQKTIEFEANLNISPKNLERLVSKADHDKDGYVDQEEFLSLISNRDKVLSKKQQSLLHQYLRVAAYAEEYRWCPPPIFILLLTFIQVTNDKKWMWKKSYKEQLLNSLEDISWLRYIIPYYIANTSSNEQQIIKKRNIRIQQLWKMQMVNILAPHLVENN